MLFTYLINWRSLFTYPIIRRSLIYLFKSLTSRPTYYYVPPSYLPMFI